MKRTLAVLLTFALLLVPYATLAETTGEQAALNYNYDELTVGNTMPLSGRFFTSMWGNGTSDNDVRDLLHGYNLVEWDPDFGGFVLSKSIVSGSVVTENRAGDHTFNLFLYRDLFYSDGTPITAWDYAFSLLLRMDPKIAELGGAPLKAEYIQGYQDYVSGRRNYLSGVQVVSDYQMKIVISHEYLPHFFEVSLLDCVPYPMSAIAPSSRIADDGKGVYFSRALNTEELKKTILDENTGYLTHPSVVSGPYCLKSFDGETATFELNPYYKGNFKGVKPQIKELIYKQANAETMIQDLLDGRFGLLNKVTDIRSVVDGLEGVEKDSRFASADYLRTGLTFISFNTEKKTVSSAAVRKAIAMCLDKDALAADYTGTYGERADGYYGMGQWMVQLLRGEIEYPTEANPTSKVKKNPQQDLKTLDALKKQMSELPVYGFDVNGAKALLNADGWTLNKSGSAYQEGTDAVRCRQVDGELVALELTLKIPQGDNLGNILQERFVKPLAEAGIQLTVTESEDLLAEYYDHSNRGADMFYLAENFFVSYDPTASFEENGAQNHTMIADKQLYNLAKAMRRTEPGDLLGYCRKWLAFQKRFIEVEPLIPVYSNVYFDFYTKALHEYDIKNNSTWSRAILPCYMGDIEETLPVTGNDGK